MKSRVLRTLMPRKARHAVSCDTYAPTALLKCFSSILIRYQYKTNIRRLSAVFDERLAAGGVALYNSAKAWLGHCHAHLKVRRNGGGYDPPFPADPERKVIEACGVWQEKTRQTAGL